GGGTCGERGWEYWKQLVMPGIAGPNRIPRPDTAAPQTVSPDQAVIDDLVLANRMLASKELGILDAFGHVSVRNPRNPNHYFISRYVSAGVVRADDIIENDLDSKPVAGPRSDEYQEVYMHGEILKSRPDVMAVLHAHTPEILAFTESSATLRPVVNGGVFIGDGFPMHDIRKFDPRENIIRTPELGKTVAMALGKSPGVLLKGHGIALTGAVLPGVQVTATQTATGLSRSAITNETGSYVLPDLPVGPYRLEAALAGFRTFAQSGIVLQVGSNPVINVSLEVGQVTESVEVQ